METPSHDLPPRFRPPSSQLSAPLAPLITLPILSYIGRSQVDYPLQRRSYTDTPEPRSKGKKSPSCSRSLLSSSRRIFPRLDQILSLRSSASCVTLDRGLHHIESARSPGTLHCFDPAPQDRQRHVLTKRSVWKGGTLGQHNQKPVLKSCHAALHGHIVTRLASRR